MQELTDQYVIINWLIITTEIRPAELESQEMQNTLHLISGALCLNHIEIYCSTSRKQKLKLILLFALKNTHYLSCAASLPKVKLDCPISHATLCSWFKCYQIISQLDFKPFVFYYYPDCRV